jgi:RNA polymerase sigma factor (sigma-70 family)
MVATKKLQFIARGASKEVAASAAELDLRNYFAFAYRVARRFAGGIGSIDDANQIALVGLVKARDHWQPQRGSFATCALLWIKSELRQATEKAQKSNGIARRERIIGKFNPAAVSAHAMQAHSFRLVSIDTPISAHDDANDTIADTLVDESTLPDELLIAKNEAAVARRRIACALSVLDERERRVIEARHLVADEPATLQALADELGGLSRETVRQIEAKALAKVRDAVEGYARVRRITVAAEQDAPEPMAAACR